MKIESDENSILKRLQWSIAANPRIEPINNDVLRAREERKILLSEFKEITLKVRVLNSAKFSRFKCCDFFKNFDNFDKILTTHFSTLWKVMTFIDGVILFENQRLPGFETDKSDMEFIKLLDAASKVYFQIITVDQDCIMRLIFDVLY